MLPRPIEGARLVRNDQLGQVIPHLTYEQSQLIVLPGKKGQGKTYGEESYIDIRESRVLVITPRADDFLRVPRSWDIDEALADLSEGGPCRRRVALALDDVNFDDVEDVEQLDIDTYAFGREVMAKSIRQLRNCLLVLSEIHLWSPYKASKLLTMLVTQGRHWGIRMMADSQRIGLVPDIVLSEATHLALFKVNRPRDIDVIKEWTSEDIAINAKRLVPRQCLLVDL